MGNWKLVPKRPGLDGKKGNGRRAPEGLVTELFDLSKDLGEQNSVAASHPEIVAQMSELLAKVRDGGRSRP